MEKGNDRQSVPPEGMTIIRKMKTVLFEEHENALKPFYLLILKQIQNLLTQILPNNYAKESRSKSIGYAYMSGREWNPATCRWAHSATWVPNGVDWRKTGCSNVGYGFM